jgi:hypothetical protein
MIGEGYYAQRLQRLHDIRPRLQPIRLHIHKQIERLTRIRVVNPVIRFPSYELGDGVLPCQDIEDGRDVEGFKGTRGG